MLGICLVLVLLSFKKSTNQYNSRARTVLDIDDDKQEDDNIGVIDYTHDDNLNKLLSLGFQPPTLFVMGRWQHANGLATISKCN